MQKIVFLFLTLLLFPGSLKADGKEAVIGYVRLFNDTGRCSCEKSPGVPCYVFNYADDITDYLRDKLLDWGYDRVVYSTNKEVEFHEWADASEDANGDDNNSSGVDSADIGFLYTHGNADSDFTRSQVGLGDGTEECWLDYGKNGGNDVQWGDGDLEYMYVYACHSMEYEVWQNDGYNSSDIRSGTRFKMLAGFHGDSMDSSAFFDKFKNYVGSTTSNGVWSNGIGEDWVNEMKSTPSGSNNDICPTVNIWTETDDDADHIYQYGGLNDYQTDYTGTGRVNYYYVKNCDSESASKLPNE